VSFVIQTPLHHRNLLLRQPIEPLSALNALSPLIITFSASSFHSAIQRFNDPNLLLRQSIQLIHQGINLPVGGLDLPLIEFLIGGDGGGG